MKMSEIEVKYRVKDFSIETIEKLGFKRKKESHQLDTYYIVNEMINGKRTYLRNRKDFLKGEYSFDLHQIESEFATKETEIKLANEKSYNDVNTILSTLGFNIICEIDKQRLTFKKDNISIVFDTVKHLGCFLEIEILGEDSIENRDILFEIANKLSLRDEDRISKKGYPDLYIEKKSKV
jgi:predicted adenylyl cyclase CyaB